MVHSDTTVTVEIYSNEYGQADHLLIFSFQNDFMILSSVFLELHFDARSETLIALYGYSS